MQRDRRRPLTKQRRRRSRTNWKGIALLILMLVGLVAGVGILAYGIKEWTKPSTQELPNVVGATVETTDVFLPQDLEAEEPEEPEDDRYVVVIDPGHGGIDGGTEGIIDEIEMIEPVAQLLYDMLDADERFNPVFTRSLDMAEDEYMGQYDRVDVATAADPDLFLSIHGNAYAGSESVRGTECFPIPYGRDYHEESLAFAKLIAAGFEAEGSVMRGDTGVRYAYFQDVNLYYEEEGYQEINDDVTYAVLQDVTYPAVLVEQCYVSSSADLALFHSDEGHLMAAEVYYQAICDYFYPDT